MYLIVIAWMYVVLMMSVAEATNSNGTLLGALVTFVLYGAGPLALVIYLMGAPTRGKAIKRRNATALEATTARTGSSDPDTGTASPSFKPDAGGHASGGAEVTSGDGGIAPMRKEP